MYLIPNCLLSSVAMLQAYFGKSRLTKSKISDLFKLCLTHCSRSAFNSSSSFQLLLAILAINIQLTTVLPLFHFWNSDNFRFDSAGPRAPNSFYSFFRDDSAGPRAELILIFFFVMITVGQGSKIKNKNCFTELQSKITITFEIEIHLNLQSKIKIKDI